MKPIVQVILQGLNEKFQGYYVKLKDSGDKVQYYLAQ